MTTTLETVLPTDNGLFLLGDAAVDILEHQQPAFEASRRPGSRASRRITTAEKVALIRCAHQ